MKVAVAALVALVAGLRAAGAAADEDGAALAARVSEERLRAHVAHLADDRLGGRLGGTETEARTARYVAERFAESGLEPGFQGSFIQEFPLVDTLIARRAALTVRDAKEGAPAIRLGLDAGLEPLVISAAGDLDVEGEAVYLGFDPDTADPNVAAGDLAGRVAFLDLGRLPGHPRPDGETAGEPLAARVLRVQARGARAVVFLASGTVAEGPLPGGVIDEGELGRTKALAGTARLVTRIVETILGTSKTGGLDMLSLLLGRVDDPARLGPWAARAAVAIPVVVATSDPLAARARAGESLRVRLTLSLERRRSVSRNVVGVLKATTEGGADGAEAIVIGAHMDHVGWKPPARIARPGEKRSPSATDYIYNGADDNASGTAAVLELARVLASLPGARPRTIVFMAFGSEEYGLVGSRHYAREPALPLARTVGMLNLDMVGRNPEKALEVAGTGSADGLDAIVDAANLALPAPLALARNDEMIARSDQMSFIEARVPAIFLCSGEHEDYHEPTDEAARIAYDRLAGATRLALGIARRWLEAAPAPAFKDSYLESLRKRRGGEDDDGDRDR